MNIKIISVLINKELLELLLFCLIKVFTKVIPKEHQIIMNIIYYIQPKIILIMKFLKEIFQLI